jgi:hypothetical protein
LLEYDEFKIYLNAFTNTINARKEDEQDKQLIARNIFYGVRLFNGLSPAIDHKEAVDNFQFANAIRVIMGLVTPKEFMNIFPIKKDFQGNKWGTKDYFYTRDYMNNLAQDKPIGENITEVTYEYQNDDVFNFVIGIMTTISSIRRFEGKATLGEEWASMNGIPTYTKHTDSAGNELLIDEQGKPKKIIKPKPRRPKHIRLLQ